MSPAEIDSHLDLIRQLRAEQQRAKFLVALHKFSRMYQHPALTDRDADDLSAAELIATSSKLRRVIEECHRIRIRREKAIVFARHIAVQSLLAKVFQAEFYIPVKIINGGTSRGGRGTATTTRSGILEEFKRKPGFNLIILSPFVAGIGLTITEANHVFHYGRWWNPAVESQATDRVYRIGQDKEVFVYLPILQDPTGQIPLTFDQRLDHLMERKYGLAQDFLTPLPSEESVAAELGEELFQEGQ
jgi:SNF2 family DNA or RNA helicase